MEEAPELILRLETLQELRKRRLRGKEWHVLKKREGEAQGLPENSVEGAREQQKMSLQEALNAKLKY